MYKLKSVAFVILTCVFFCCFAEAVNTLVKIEVKKFDGSLVFIFYHDKNQEVSISAKGKLVTAILDRPVEMQLLNSASFKQFASTLQVSPDKKKITFVTNEAYSKLEIINGEKLTAVKFHVTEPEKQIEPVAAPELLSPVIENKTQNTSFDHSNIDYKLIKNEHTLSFDFSKQDVGMAAFFRGKYLWLVFDQPKLMTFKNDNNAIFSDFSQIFDKSYTILKLKVNGYNSAYISKKNGIWSLALTKNEQKNDAAITPTILTNQIGLKLPYGFSTAKIIEIEDRLIGDKIKVLTVKTPNVRIATLNEFIDFNLIPSIQGVAIVVSSDDGVSFVEEKESLSVLSNNNMLTSDNAKNENGKIRLHKELADTSSLLPIRGLSDDDIDFVKQRSILIRKASNSPDPKSLFASQIEIARFYFVNNLYSESLGAFELSKKNSISDYNTDLKTQFQKAVAYTLVGMVDKAATIYTDLLSKVSDSEEIELWNNYNNYVFGKNPASLAFLPNINKFISEYPDPLYWPLALTEIELSLTVNNFKSVEAIFKELRTPPVGNFANSLQFFKATYYRKKGQINLAKQFWQDLIEREDDPFNQVRSTMELVKLQISKKEITLTEAIAKLEKLRFAWRGDTLEYNFLQLLAGYYRDNKDGINALRVFNYIAHAFSNQISNFYLTSEMVKIFNTIFSPGGSAEKMSAFRAVALFYEFKELNPVGAEGDEVILFVAKRLIELDLLDQAVNILQHQVAYRLTGEKRIINANHLAIALIMSKKPAEAIAALESTDLDNIKFDEHKYRVRLKAKALIDLKLYSEALESLAKDYSEDAIIIKKECLFRAEKWQEYIDLVEPLTNTATFSNKISEPMQQDILRLAISYYMVNDQAMIVKLSQSSVTAASNNLVKDTIELLMTSGQPIDYKNLDQSLNINQMQNLVDKYKSQLFS